MQTVCYKCGALDQERTVFMLCSQCDEVYEITQDGLLVAKPVATAAPAVGSTAAFNPNEPFTDGLGNVHMSPDYTATMRSAQREQRRWEAACAALTGLMACRYYDQNDIAEDAVKQANALLAQFEQVPDPPVSRR